MSIIDTLVNTVFFDATDQVLCKFNKEYPTD
jgi:hypothetical protein